MDKKITTEQIVSVLKKAAKIKDRIIPLCEPELRWQGRTKGYTLCPKCYPEGLKQMQEWFRINDTDTREQVKAKVEKLFERVAELENKVNELTEMMQLFHHQMMKTDRVLKVVLKQTDRLLKELENSKLFEKATK